jgi:hypothetical protein
LTSLGWDGVWRDVGAAAEGSRGEEANAFELKPPFFWPSSRVFQERVFGPRGLEGERVDLFGQNLCSLIVI